MRRLRRAAAVGGGGVVVGGGGARGGAREPKGRGLVDPAAGEDAALPRAVRRAAARAARPLAEGGLAPACALPPEYDRALTAKFQRVADFQRELAGIECPPELRAEVQATLQSHFKEWLVRTGNMRQITDLLKLADAEGAGEPEGDYS